MDAATIGVLIGGFLLGAGFYWAWTPTAPLGVMEPYLGHESFRRMHFWVWIKFLVIFLPSVIYFPEADPDHPLAQIAWAALLGGFSIFHVTDNGVRFTSTFCELSVRAGYNRGCKERARWMQRPHGF